MERAKWILDLSHSDIQFKIRHLVIANISGYFRAFSGTMYAGKDDFTDAEFKLTVDVYSVDTNNVERDEHLKSADFFNADYYPEMEFVSQSFNHIDGDRYDLTGNITIKGITRPITFKVLFGGEAKDGFGNMRAGFDITGEVNRNDFDIHSNDTTEAGGLVLGEEIKMHANIQFVKETDYN
ncbi:YceI family protein [Flavobacterium alkalisoli]|uniref:YceI family protein n=1 Tax=Flavobacterium alkalisoli TaxID=2602769 RepID=A0A5B9FVZ3_9FLAO|nr:YceI family protein [Flavobacterium alkalisoli]QEE51202.1 YceI family protein [Flavobacterium alkalisoli]QEE51220.1 YceI family protein [Flavobacterium alkalisoli]